MNVRALEPNEIRARLEELARLRITVFRDWPYLYEGDLEYERRYLRPYVDSPDAVVVGAFAGERLVGCATGTPMRDHAHEFATAFAESGIDLSEVFYCAESVLLSDFRGQGIGHRFFDIREAKARALGCRYVAFCAVVRPDDHPLKPPHYRPLDSFWRKRGYEPLPGVIAHFRWRDVGEQEESEKPLQFWLRALS